MKKTIQLFMFLAVLGLTITSCGKDEADECTNLSEVLVGTWEADLLGAGTFEFQADGTFIDSANLLVADEINGEPIDSKTWSVTGNTKLTITATKGLETLNAALDVDSYECDVINISQGAISVKFRRT